MADKEGASPARASGVDDLNPLQRQRVDQAFEKLFGYKWVVDGEHEQKLQGKNEPPAAAKNDDSNTAAATMQVLSEILGRPAAARLLRSHRHLAHLKVQFVVRKKHQDYKVPASAFRHLPQLPPPAARKITSSAASKRPDASMSAGEEAKNKPAPAAADAAKKPAATAVDHLLLQLTGPNKVSTVAKTHSDWDQFKERTGLGEALEEQADSKTAFLKRQDFLQRVDHRTFEKERQERDRERAKRGT